MEGELQSEGPAEITLDNALFWCKHTRELKGSLREKIDSLQALGNLKYLGKTHRSKYTFVCLRLDTSTKVIIDDVAYRKKPYSINYNKTDYYIWKDDNRKFNCECQGWKSRESRGEGNKEGFQCKHSYALAACFKRKLFGKSQGAEDHHLEVDKYD